MALCPAPRPGPAVPWSPPGPAVALWRPPQGPHSRDILSPLHQHPDPFTPRLVFRGPPVTVAPVSHSPSTANVSTTSCAGRPTCTLGVAFCLPRACPAFQQPALARLHLHLGPSLGEGPPSKCILLGSTPLASTTPGFSSTIILYHHLLSQFPPSLHLG